MPFQITSYSIPLKNHQSIQIHAAGQGETTLIFLSGLGDSASRWFPQATVPSVQASLFQQLAQHTQVIAYDRAGMGFSSKPTHDRTWDELYFELLEVIGHGSPTYPPVLVGHSLGGLIAYTFAKRYTKQVSGVVLLDPTPPPLSSKPSAGLPEPLALTHFESEELAPGGLGDLPLLLIAPGLSRQVDQSPQTHQTQVNQEAMEARFEQRRLQHQQLLQTSHQSQGFWTSGSDHYVHLEHPAEVAEAILKFLPGLRR